MAFSRNKLTCYANNARTGVVVSLWFYDNTVDDTVTTGGFIEDNRLAVNDIVTVVASNHSVKDYYVSVASKGKATLVACPTGA